MNGDTRAAVGTALVAAGAGAAFVVSPAAVVVVVALSAVAWALTRAWSRLVLVLAGGLLVFQSSDALTPTKAAYFALFALCFTISAVRVVQAVTRERFEVFRPLPVASLLLGCYLLVTLTTSLVHGIAPVDWLRDVVPYILLMAMPIIGLDAGMDVSHQAAIRILVIVGAAAVIGFTVTFLARRHVSSIPVARLLLASVGLCVVPFCYALARGLVGPRRVRWLVYASVIVLLLLTTGTRTTLAFLVAAIVMIGSADKARASVARVLGVCTALAATGVLLLPMIASVLARNPQTILARLTGVLSLDASQDRSYVQRERAYRLAADTWNAHPLFGTGPGHRYGSVSEFGTQGGGYSLDTPLLVLSKFGLVGAMVLCVYFVVVGMVFVASRRVVGYSVVSTSARATFWVLLALLPFGQFLEDKGLAFGIGLLTLLVVTWHALRAPATGPPAGSIAAPEARLVAVGAYPAVKPAEVVSPAPS